MIDNIKELDTAMINLQRVTHETGEGYERFLANASDRAKELKTTTSALIEQSYQWAKLGYDMEDSLKLSEASTIFSRVADVGQEQALKNLVTAMKAYGIEAEDVMSIVDKLDKLNNEYAVSAAGLGDGLERAASAMAMTGNSIDQTLAMLTGAGEITQNLENTANGLRIVGLR
jgi:TP901 family phage tail tape measure protein